MKKRFTIKCRPQGAKRWTTIHRWLTEEEAADTLAEEMYKDEKWDNNYEYQIITE